MRRRARRIPVEDLYTLWAAAASVLSAPEVQAAWCEHMLDLGTDPGQALLDISKAVARIYPVVARYAGLPPGQL